MSKLPKSRCFNFPKAIAPVFDQPGATLIHHGADKFEMRFQPSAALAFFARVVPVFLTLLIVLSLAAVTSYYFGKNFFVQITSLIIFTLAAVLIYGFHVFFRKRVAPRLLEKCYARGLVCNASLLNFTVWNRLYENVHASATVPFADVRDVVLIRGNRLALATSDGKTFPFTRALRNPGAAGALRGFIKNLTTFDTSLSPRWREAAAKATHKQHPESTPLRFSKRANPRAAKLPTHRHFTPPQ